ncbi:MAG: zinc ABC transporter solute-binding protein [Epsilonproteobacteria bacterium]|nr:zinc ABC transporter solute-binding protein [Campylobacterota bacterium]
MKKAVFMFLLALPLFGLNVCVSILPQSGVVKAIGKEKVNISVLVPPGISPAIYSLNIKELKKIKNSQIYFKIGVPFDKKYLPKFKEINPDMEIVDFGEWINKTSNPHIWLSPALLMLEAKAVLNTLIKHDPKNKEYYLNNYRKYINKLSLLEKEGFNISQKSFLTFHPSFHYFAKDFNLKEIAIEKEGKSPSFAYLARIIKLAKKENIKTVIISPEFPSKYAKIIAQKISAKVVTISPLEKDPTNTVKKLIKALK